MIKRIAVLAGDGIGPEIMNEAKKVLMAVASRFSHTFDFVEALVGGAAFDKSGSHLPQETVRKCEACDAILFGAVGGPVEFKDDPKWDCAMKEAILGLRKAFDFSINLTPVRVFSALRNNSLLRDEFLSGSPSILIIREFAGGIYFGEHSTRVKNGNRVARDVMEYSESSIETVVRFAFESAMKRKKKLTCIDKSNVLDCGLLWRSVVERVGKEFPEIKYNFMFIDNAVFQILKSPLSFDTIVTDNMFGDILNYLSAVFPGSIGLVPSASFNANKFGIYEPSGGTAPDIAGKNIANPLAMILSLALMLKYSFKMEKEAMMIEKSVEKVLDEGFRTVDIYHDGMKRVSTSEMGDLIVERIKDS